MAAPSSLYVVVRKHAQRRPVHIFVLSAAQRPEERCKASQAERERHRHEIDQDVHVALAAARVSSDGKAATERAGLRARTRNALSVTRIDEPDIAAAAISGVANPAMTGPCATVLETT